MNQAHTTHFSTGLRLLCGLALLIGLCIMMGGLARPAHAQSNLTVTDCSSDTQLQTAVTQANSDNAGDVITFDCSGDIKLSSTLSISGSMSIDGSGQSVTLDGNNSLQAFSVNSGVSLSLKALTVAHGFTGGNGGGLYNGGGTVSITNSTFANNSASGNGFTSGNGGGLANNGGSVSITNSIFTGNSVPSSGFTSGNGGAISSNGSLTINDSTFTSNLGYFGTVYNKGNVSITSSTFASNRMGFGGGLYNEGNSTASITNSTFANNIVGYGGGLENNDNGTMTITNSTIAYNSGYQGGGIDNGYRGTLSIGGSIVANNFGGNCSLLKAIISTGYNLESATNCGFMATGELQNTDPKLDSHGLQSNGGPTQTIALQQGSPAIDWVASGCPSTDQRGMTRPDDPSEANCDIGAYESYPPDTDLALTNVPANMTVNATSAQGAVVTYTAPTVVDESGDSSTASVSCTPASGSTFPIGTTKVTCTASDSDDTNSPVSGSFQVVVKDVTAPTLSLPSPITVDATSPQGAPVSYTVTATDPDNAASDLKISCSPASGSIFPIGTTTVNCTATDPSGNSSSGSFQVVVKGAAAQVKDLITTVNGDHFTSSLQTALDNKLNDVLTAINAGQTTTSCSELTDFIGFVQSHTGKGITTSQATQLVAAAKQVQAVLGC